MKLSRWIKLNGYTQKTFFDSCRDLGGDFSTHALAKWCNGQRVPRTEEMEFIYMVTKGEVEPNDFYCLTKKEASP